MVFKVLFINIIVKEKMKMKRNEVNNLHCKVKQLNIYGLNIIGVEFNLRTGELKLFEIVILKVC